MTVPTTLIDAYLDEDLREEQAAELRAWLGADREHMRTFLRLTEIHRGLRHELVSAETRSRFSQEGDSAGVARSRQSSRRSAAIVRKKSITWQRWTMALAACLAVGIAVRQFVVAQVSGETVLITTGSVQVKRVQNLSTAHVGDRLRSADILNTDEGAGVDVQFSDKTIIHLAGGSRLVLTHLDSDGSGKRLTLEQGRLVAEVSKQPSNAPLIIRTPAASALVVGTVFTLTAVNDSTRLEVDNGRVRLQRLSDQASVEVAAGEFSVAAPEGALVVRKQGHQLGTPLRIDGNHHNQLRGPDGQRFVMKGAQVFLNQFFAQIGSPWESRLADDHAMYERAFKDRFAQLDAMKRCGINTVRIFMGGEAALDRNNGFRTSGEGYGGLSGYVQRLVTYADDARDRGFHVIFCYSGDDGWSEPAHWFRYQQLLSALVPALRDNANVLYELINEPDLPDSEWTRCSLRAIDTIRSFGYAGPLIVDLDHVANWWYEPEVERVASHDPQLVFSLHWAKWVGWERTAALMTHGVDRALILGEFSRVLGNDLGEAEAIAVAGAMRDLIERGSAVGAIALSWNGRDAQPPLPGTGMTDDLEAIVPNSWGDGYRKQFSGRLPDWLPTASSP